MEKVFAKNMSRKSVTSIDGVELGIAVNIIINTRTGELKDLVVKPNHATDTKFKMKGNIMYIPFASVRSVRDHVIIDTKLAESLSEE
ncbi:MAG: PRC-barrel domain containing protein [Methanosarcinales archaeon]|uniref:PRC-barrel domain containing protein n=1 Tax=Candidatus Ethanoperedens thermophilum TaxID=2766897 RepID=A0A848D6B8_9EURY|nr:PRC-barrel domain containing protein [Candidatus Ethanoperedens thermophilum]